MDLNYDISLILGLLILNILYNIDIIEYSYLKLKCIIPVLFSLGCFNNISQTEWLKATEILVSQFLRQGVQGQGLVGWFLLRNHQQILSLYTELQISFFRALNTEQPRILRHTKRTPNTKKPGVKSCKKETGGNGLIRDEKNCLNNPK